MKKKDRAVELLAEGSKTFTEVAQELHITTETLRRWRKQDDFQADVRSKCREILVAAEPMLYNIALEHAKAKGSFQHIKILLERIERLEDIADGVGPDYGVMFTWKKTGNE